jgi:ornithine carbamoyltransferase
MHINNLALFSKEILEQILNESVAIKSRPNDYKSCLSGKKLYMLFEKTSTRTAVAFGFGFVELGGAYMMQKFEDSNFSIGEIRDEIRYISHNADIMLARMKLNESIAEMETYSSIPIINGCCNKFHPTQAFADMLTIKELFGTFNVKMLYVGVWNNVFNSLLQTLPKLGGTLYGVVPLRNENAMLPEIDASRGPSVHILEGSDLTAPRLRDLVQSLDIVYTDTWMDMEFFKSESHSKKGQAKIDVMKRFQLNKRFLAGSKAIVMHDMPIHPEFEITREVIEMHRQTIFKQSENRRHVAKGIVKYLLTSDHKMTPNH